MKITVKNQFLVAITALGISTSPITSAAIVNATVDVQISTNIAISAVAGLSFGNLTSGPLGGSVVLDTEGERVATGSVNLNQSSISSPAILYISGIPNAPFTLVLPTTLTLTEANGGAGRLTVTDFRSNPGGSGQLSGNGAQIVSVGGTLNVGANQSFGSYLGYMSVVIMY